MKSFELPLPGKPELFGISFQLAPEQAAVFYREGVESGRCYPIIAASWEEMGELLGQLLLRMRELSPLVARARELKAQGVEPDLAMIRAYKEMAFLGPSVVIKPKGEGNAEPG